jgi:hypothetical protein
VRLAVFDGLTIPKLPQARLYYNSAQMGFGQMIEVPLELRLGEGASHKSRLAGVPSASA